jgi:hypothetical protein
MAFMILTSVKLKGDRPRTDQESLLLPDDPKIPADFSDIHDLQ